VPLPDAPLVRVIAQVRFPLVASIAKQDFIGPFQEAIRGDFPILRAERSQVVVGLPARVETGSTVAWRFHDAVGSWRVSLAPDFVALDTLSYTSRDDFLARFEQVITALQEHVDPKVLDRIGVRYVDRVVGDNLRDLKDLVRSEVLGVMGTPFAGQVQQAVAENIFDLPDESGRLKARWGLVPARATIDPAAAPAVDEPSWVLDLDAFTNGPLDLDIATVISRARRFAERIYSFFRWTVEDEFLRRYGGEP
jgi:uncharacterized protein (TIGR04255 family)